MELKSVQKPVRYIGQEWNSVQAKPNAELRFAFSYPDVYEVGMSYLGLQILYGLLNEQPWIWCERVFAPWPDREKQIRDEGALLGALESGTALRDMHIVGFSLQHEMLYTNVLAMLELGGVPIEAGQRGDQDPLVVAGGPCAYNPAPMVDFIDAFVIGEAEEAILELCQAYRTWRQSGAPRKTLLETLSRIEGIFVPSCYAYESNRYGESFPARSLVEGAPDMVQKRLVKDFETSYYPTKQIVPNTRVVHHRLALEVMRGCPGGCRFCQAGYTDRPVRERSPERLMRDAEEGLKQTGFNEVGLMSLSTADYTQLPSVCSGLIQQYYPERISLSLPSLRIDAFPARVAQEIGKVSNTGLTFAPEAGTERLRWAINKLIYDAEIFAKVRESVDEGQATIKFYFMVGLPTETDEDLQGIVDMVLEIKRIIRNEKRNRRATIHVGVSPFVPKPHTAYQWYGQVDKDEIIRRIQYIRSRLARQGVKVNWHDPEKSLVEGALARGDAHVGRAIRFVYEQGGRFDEWGEHFRYDLWENAFAAIGRDVQEYASRAFDREDSLPWKTVSIRVSERYLWREWEKTFRTVESRHCGNEMCRVCKVCDGDEVITVHANAVAAPKSKYNMEHELAGELKSIQHAAVSTQDSGERAINRLRMRFSKFGSLAFASHHDMMMLLESLLRRGGVAMAFTEGFTPRPKLTFAAPLAVGGESRGEYVDVAVTREYNPEDLVTHLNAIAPHGLRIDRIAVVPLSDAKITALVVAFEFDVALSGVDAANAEFHSIQETVKHPEWREPLALIRADVSIDRGGKIRLNYVTKVDGGKYAKPEIVIERLSETAGSPMAVGDVIRLDMFRRDELGEYVPLIETAEATVWR